MQGIRGDEYDVSSLFGARFSSGALLAASVRAVAAPPVETYGKLPALEDVSLSPLGDRYALIAVAGDTRKLVVATTEDAPLFAMNVGSAKVRDVTWAGNDHLLVSVSGTKSLDQNWTVAKGEFLAVVAINVVDRRRPSACSTNIREVMDQVWGRYGSAQIGGQWYGYFSGVITYGEGTTAGDRQLDHGYPDLYRVDLDTGATHVVAQRR